MDWLCFNEGHCWFGGNAHYETDNSWNRGSQRGRVCSHSFKGRMKESLTSIFFFFFFYPNQSVFYCCLFTVFLLAVPQLMFIPPSPPHPQLSHFISACRRPSESVGPGRLQRLFCWLLFNLSSLLPSRPLRQPSTTHLPCRFIPLPSSHSTRHHLSFLNQG